MNKHKRRYKDSVFVDLFGKDKNAKANFLSPYNALHGRTLDMSTELTPLHIECLPNISPQSANLNHSRQPPTRR